VQYLIATRVGGDVATDHRALLARSAFGAGNKPAASMPMQATCPSASWPKIGNEKDRAARC
jgi:L,D-peptidoglycan transpeptidase YkuD (ErfK/YbiS/YcfS/YnhG family)